MNVILPGLVVLVSKHDVVRSHPNVSHQLSVPDEVLDSVRADEVAHPVSVVLFPDRRAGVHHLGSTALGSSLELSKDMLVLLVVLLTPDEVSVVRVDQSTL